jgi:hypothetical protein
VRFDVPLCLVGVSRQILRQSNLLQSRRTGCSFCAFFGTGNLSQRSQLAPFSAELHRQLPIKQVSD